MSKIRLGVTMGCPAGVGPELILKALTHPFPEDLALVVLGDENLLREAARKLSLPLPLAEIISLSQLPYRPGAPNEETARAMVRYIKEGVRLCLEGQLAGLVTCPISKAALKLAGEPFPGHTEMLAALTGAREVAMAFYGKRLSVVLVTIHVPLRKVPELVTVPQILRVTRLAYQFLKDLKPEEPRLALAALNPHAGEGGLFGDEEERVLQPAVEEARRQGIPLSGPYPADSLFYRAVKGDFDLVVGLYHDQALIPFKLLHFEDGVNVTLGLPIIRTSVDHGTAYDIAGQGVAREKSLVAAIELAYRLAKNRLKGL